jgi:hypothetical protein
MSNPRISFRNDKKVLKYDINAICTIEDKLGGSFVELLTKPEQLQKISSIRILVWAGMLHNNPELTLEQAGGIISDSLQDGDDFISISEAITQAISSCGLIDEAAADSYNKEERGSTYSKK